MKAFLMQTIARATKKITRDKKLYLPVLFQLALGFLVFNIFLSLLFNHHSNYHRLIQEGGEFELVITATEKEFDAVEYDLMKTNDRLPYNSGEGPFGESIINELTREYGTAIALVQVNLLYFGDKAVVTDDVVSPIVLEYSNQYSTVSMSEESRNRLEDLNDQNTVNISDFPFQLDNEYLIALNGTSYEIMIDNDLENIRLPLGLYYSLYSPKDLFHTSVHILNSNIELEDVQNVLLILNNGNDDQKYSFQINNSVMDYLGRNQVALRDSKVLLINLVLVFLIITIGLSGLFLTMISKRKRESAICLMIGQTKRQLIFEYTMEIFILVLFSLFLGIGTSCLVINQGISFATVPVEINFVSIFVLTSIAFLLAIVVTIPMIKKIASLSPIEILSSL